MGQVRKREIKGVTILGSTGTIGKNTLDVVRRHPDRYRVVALTANQSVDLLHQQCVEFQPNYAVMRDPGKAEELRARLLNVAPAIEVLAGAQGLEAVAGAADTDYVMAAIVGAAGLMPTLTAAREGKRVLLANKEALVMSGKLFMQVVRENGAELLPIDSEHNAVFQCMPVDFDKGLSTVGVERILLTGSGGPFRDRPIESLHEVSPQEACAHPNWVMGRKISVDSATMMNKGLEVIEACWLFGTENNQIEVVIHPQSVIHSMVSYADGSVLAQLGNPDMRTPIAHAMAWPDRVESGVSALDLLKVGRLDFEPPDEARFPCLRLARQAMDAGGTTTAILNAANEVAVQSFLDEQIAFTEIPRVIEHTLNRVESHQADSLETVLHADGEARNFAQRVASNAVVMV